MMITIVKSAENKTTIEYIAGHFKNEILDNLRDLCIYISRENFLPHPVYKDLSCTYTEYDRKCGVYT